MITNEERIEVLSKIEKILAHTQTESGAVNVNEMAIANKLVKELMDKYEISINTDFRQPFIFHEKLTIFSPNHLEG